MHQDTAELQRLGMHWIYCANYESYFDVPRTLCHLKQGTVCKLVRKEHVWSNKHFDACEVCQKCGTAAQFCGCQDPSRSSAKDPSEHGAQRDGISLGAHEKLGPIQKFPGATARQCKTSLSSH
jgi:hypothetical protein